MRELFFIGEEENKARRAARLLHRLTGKTVYLNEDFGNGEDDPWGFFVSTTPDRNVYTEIGGN